MYNKTFDNTALCITLENATLCDIRIQQKHKPLEKLKCQNLNPLIYTIRKY